ncbi:kunitz-type serine protease inhibitor textilinin-2 [Anabrus simplex]|uniref:kunitz-type serine protease inhibitor textilinin-2 n=1 Tax=Anabrus simplex TaxID=316456 RepID=UPI0035A32D69
MLLEDSCQCSIGSESIAMFVKLCLPLCVIALVAGTSAENQSTPASENTTPEPIPDLCYLDAETGDCRAMYQRFFFNKSTQKCEFFIYGGCHGNSNNFQTQEDCERMCVRHNTENNST